MAVVALRDARAAYAAPTKRVTLYCVQVYWQDRTGPKRGKFLQFGSAGEAIAAGKIAATRASGVAVFRLRGFVEADYTVPNDRLDDFRLEPRVLATYGQVPDH